MVNTAVSVSSSVLAFVTTIHAALLVVHLHRVRGLARAGVALPALGFGVQPWVLSAPAWLAAGLGAHALWVLIDVFVAARAAARRVTAAADQGPQQAPGAPRKGFVPTRVLAVIDETATIRTFRLARPPGFDFQAGQFAMVRVEASGQTHARCYSISSAPGNAGYLEISVRRQGLVSGALHAGIGPGDTLTVHPPLGRFTIPAGGREEMVLLAGGIGITPLMSMLRHAVSAEPERKVTLLYSARTLDDIAFRDELIWLRGRCPQLRVVFTLTGGTAPGCLEGRIGEALIREQVADLERALFFICGPLPMIDAVRAALEHLGVGPGRVRFEAFEAAAAVAAEAEGEAPPGVPGRLRLLQTGCEVQMVTGETLLEAAERAGAGVASFCRAGICGTCRTRVASGEVRCPGEALSDEERQNGYVLPCVARAVGDCALEA